MVYAEGMMGKGIAIWLFAVAAVSFVFSVVFWLTHNWLAKRR